MIQEQIISNAPKVTTYNDKTYSITLAKSWKIQKFSNHQTFFFGPQVGKVRVGFYITSIPKNGKNYLDAAEKMKNTQMLEEAYTIIQEKDISGKNYKSFMRRSHWYNKEIDMTLFVRDVFTQSGNNIFILSCSIPNTSNISEIDKTAVAMMNSFRFR